MHPSICRICHALVTTWRSITGGLFSLVLLSACGDGLGPSDAYGNFEAVDVIISSEASGKLIRFTAREGDRLEAGTQVGLVDTLQTALRRRQLEANRQAVRSRSPQVLAEIAVLNEQREIAENEAERVRRLLAGNAATEKQLDDLEGQIRVLDRRIQSIRTQNASILMEIEGLDAQIALLDDQIARSFIVNPILGIVLQTYAEQHELTAPGKALYKIANLDTLELRAYISGARLADVRSGASVEVLYDAGPDRLGRLPGTVSWISSEAEFTPKMVQTREERLNQVYAFKVRVPNPQGVLKIGMPGEVRLTTP